MRVAEVKVSLTLLVIVSFFLHLVFMVSAGLPDMTGLLQFERIMRRFFTGNDTPLMRDIIVNINEDDKRIINESTLLSERDSSAKGYLTTKKGDRWLNNSLDFKYLKKGGNSKSAGASAPSQAAAAQKAQSKMKADPIEEKSGIIVFLEKIMPKIIMPQTIAGGGEGGASDKLLIPDKNGVSRENAIYYSNSGLFSFNTAKFKNFQYFKSMKDKIAANWYPPLLANANLGGFAPGVVRLRMIPNQEVKLYFTMDRDGKVLDVEILDSYHNEPLDSSCLDAIRLSKNFGKVPDNIEGKVVVIPFIFGFYSY